LLAVVELVLFMIVPWDLPVHYCAPPHQICCLFSSTCCAEYATDLVWRSLSGLLPWWWKFIQQNMESYFPVLHWVTDIFETFSLRFNASFRL